MIPAEHGFATAGKVFFHNKVLPMIRAVVTGASSGIGQAAAIALAKTYRHRNEAPVKIVVHYRNNESGAEQTADQIRQQGGQALTLSADLNDAAACDALLDQSWQWLSVPNTWINFAGVDVLTGEAKAWSFERKLKQLMEVDVLATIKLNREVANRMLAGPESGPPPSITFVGWDQAPLGMEGEAGQMFGPVKAAVMAFANSLAQQCAPKVRVNTVAPGWIQTSWGQTTDSYWNDRAQQQSLMNRWGKPADVARAVCWLSDPENTFCTGQTLEVNGGWNRQFDR